MDQKDSAAILTVKRSAGVAPEDQLYTGDKASKLGIHHGLESQGRHHQKFKTGVPVAPPKGFTSAKIKNSSTDRSVEIDDFHLQTNHRVSELLHINFAFR